MRNDYMRNNEVLKCDMDSEEHRAPTIKKKKPLKFCTIDQSKGQKAFPQMKPPSVWNPAQIGSSKKITADLFAEHDVPQRR